MRADIHDGPEHMLQSEAGYIDARPLTPARQNLLQRTAGPYIWVKNGPDGLEMRLPVYPYERTSSDRPSWSVSCHFRTSCSKKIYGARCPGEHDDPAGHVECGSEIGVADCSVPGGGPPISSP